MGRRRTATAPARCAQSNLSGEPLRTCPDHAWARGLMTNRNSDLMRRAIVEPGIFLARSTCERVTAASHPDVDSNHIRANHDCATRDQEFRGDLVGDPY